MLVVECGNPGRNIRTIGRRKPTLSFGRDPMGLQAGAIPIEFDIMLAGSSEAHAEQWSRRLFLGDFPCIT
jgi:hypothetical protein